MTVFMSFRIRTNSFIVWAVNQRKTSDNLTIRVIPFIMSSVLQSNFSLATSIYVCIRVCFLCCLLDVINEWMNSYTPCTPGSAPGPTLGNEYGKSFYVFLAPLLGWPHWTFNRVITLKNHNYHVSSRSRTLLLVLSWKLPSHVISLLSYALFTGSGSLNASNTSSSHLPTKFSQLYPTFIRSSPLNVLAVLALHPSLLLLGHLHHPL